MQLQIEHVLENGKSKFQVVRGDDLKRSTAVELPSPQEVRVAGDKKLLDELKWYLENYLELPLGAYCETAEQVLKALKDWGRECFDKLFYGGNARDWFQNARQGGLENLRLKISSNDPVILSWPWEAINSHDDDFLALRCCIERQLTDLSDPLPLPENLPTDQINMLLIVARPDDDEDVGYHTLARPILDGTKELQLPIQVDVLRPATFKQLQKTLEDKPGFYHIVHFDGHGGYGVFANRQGNNYVFQGSEGVLVFEEDEKASDKEAKTGLISAHMLSQLLAEHRIPVMVLNACQSAAIDKNAEDCFASVACSLQKAGIRSVVAMSHSLYVSGAKEFVPNFYEHLFKNGNIAEALRAGRKAMYQNASRDCVIGQHDLQDWMVPVLYQQLPANKPIIPVVRNNKKENEKTCFVPEDAQHIGDYGFIGREAAILNLERAMQKQSQAGILVHGMAGIGKTTLIKGFLQWLNDTNGLEREAIWFNFEGIRSAEFVVNQLLEPLYGTNAMVAPIEQKIAVLVQIFRDNRFVMVWDNFESVSGIDGTEVTPLMPEEDRMILKNLLRGLRGGKTKILITSRASEDWLDVQECFRLSLGGLYGQELWTYCNAVVSDLGLKLERKNADYAELIGRLDGNPLAIRSMLLCLGQRSARQLIKELDTAFTGLSGDESTNRIQTAFQLLEKGIDPMFAPVLQLIGLHEHFFDTDYLKAMFASAGENVSEDTLSRAMKMLTTAGYHSPIGLNIYRMHPAFRGCLMQTHPASETLRRAFVDIMGSLADAIAPKELHEQRHWFMIHEANSYHAARLASELRMEVHDLALTQCLAVYAQNMRNFLHATRLFEELAQKCEHYNRPEHVAITYHRLGSIAQEQRDFATAESWYKKSLAISEKHGNEHDAASSYGQLGILHIRMDQPEQAGRFYLKALAGFANTNDGRSVNITAANFVRLHKSAGGPMQQTLQTLWTDTGFDLETLHSLEKQFEDE